MIINRLGGRLAVAGLMGIFALTCGCSSTKRVPVYRVKGRLLSVDHKPAVGATVTFHPLGVNDGYPFVPHGTVGTDGTFILTSYASGDGAPAGEYAVTVIWRIPTPEGDAIGPDRLKGRYAKPAQPLARVTIQEHDNELEPFQLK